MDDLFYIFEREQKRCGKDFTIFYNKNKNSIQYIKRDEETKKDGVLTVIFNPETMGETFYFATKDEHKTHGIGELVFQTAYAGQLGKGDANSFFPVAIKEKIGDKVGQAFVNLIQSYQFDRKSIAIETEEDKKRIRKSAINKKLEMER